MTAKTALKILNVAEKPSIAKKITEFLSLNAYDREKSQSKYNPVFSFQYDFPLNKEIQTHHMNVTSITGHLTQTNFINNNYKWKDINPQDLFKGASLFII